MKTGDDDSIGKIDIHAINDIYGDKKYREIGSVIEEEKGQMPIFYSGKVNVYDDIPTDKERALLQLAASPLQFPHEDPVDGNLLQQPPNINLPILRTVFLLNDLFPTMDSAYHARPSGQTSALPPTSSTNKPGSEVKSSERPGNT
uniref:Tify domain-containing protein n=1 Tax=Lactuca sativa TaxID=4236 RepID=A0A9R1WYB6_LACSA|nr:hypothetical protein LSAT_V11C800452860 [Lactuca sativa]